MTETELIRQIEHDIQVIHGTGKEDEIGYLRRVLSRCGYVHLADDQSLPDIEQVFADVAGLPKNQHKNVLGDKWKYINAVTRYLAGFRKVQDAGI